MEGGSTPPASTMVLNETVRFKADRFSFGMLLLVLPLNVILIYVAPPPIFAGLKTLDNRMAGLVKMLRGMFVLGRITTTDVTTFEAYPKVDPRVAEFQALLAPFQSAGRHVVNVVLMRATHVGFIVRLSQRRKLRLSRIVG